MGHQDAPKAGPPRSWKVGELSKHSALSIRTLHFYEEIGLLKPSQRSPSGHRLYGQDELLRLQRILSLRQMGFSLDEIQVCLDRPEFALAPLVQLHLARLAEQMASMRLLMQRLSTLNGLLEAEVPIPVSQILQTMETMSMIDRYLSPDQLAGMDARREAYEQAHDLDLLDQQIALFAALRKHLDAGDDPATPAVQALVQQHLAFGVVSTGDDPALAEAIGKLFEEQAEMQALLGLDEALMAYLARANAWHRKAP